MERRKEENGHGRRNYDGTCPVHGWCVTEIKRNSSEIDWMRKLMLKTLIGVVIGAVSAMGTLVMMILSNWHITIK